MSDLATTVGAQAHPVAERGRPHALPQSSGLIPSARVPELAGGQATLALLVLCHGAAATLDEVEAYYAHILHGRTPRPDRLQALKERYRAIGGSSPLNRLTRLQASQMAAGLRAVGIRARPYVGFQHVPPFIGDAVRSIVEDGLAQAEVVVMTPYYSPQGVGRYLAEVERAVKNCGEEPALTPTLSAAKGKGKGLQVQCIRSWYQESEFLALLEGRVRDALDALGVGAGSKPTPAGPCHVIFTAHSLPIPAGRGGVAPPSGVALPEDDPYVAQFGATARIVADRIGLLNWSTCYQSASDTGQPWLGPDILEELDRVYAAGARRVVVCPTSFAADNLEVLYDIGLEAAEHARRLGMAYAQTAPFNDDPAFTSFLAGMIAHRLGVTAFERLNV